MTSKGIRILDKTNNIVAVELQDIFEEIVEGYSFNWSILWLYATGNLGNDQSLDALTEDINKLEKGLVITWDDLNNFIKKLWDVMEITIIGCKDIQFLKRYETDQEMYETCDIVIEMIDSGYWEIFSKDNMLIDRLASKFKDIKFLEPDFEK